ncbi:MAG: TonB-dependent receptor [Bacteroidales bacterium]|nr:TonB-dependent receptor [Bacteroidales bacterium]
MNRLLMRRLMIVIAGIMMSSVLFGQQITVTGTVTDALEGITLPGVNVLVKGTSSGTTTNADGEYSISLNPDAVLVFSFIGYVQQEIPVNNRTTINVDLQVDVLQIDEVVTIGYGTVKRDDLTGSVSAISSKDFNRGSITSAQELLVGKTAGVVITTLGGRPGSGSTIRIRGGSSLNASNDPLIIIDGVPIDNNNVSGSPNFLDFVNPNDIETFTVLKDASSTAIYGSRASNGVIIIETKKAKAGSAMSVRYDGRTSVATAIEYMDVYSGDQIRQIAYDKMDLYGASTVSLLGSENTNWQDEIFRTAVSQDHNLSVSGSYESLPYRFSAGYTDERGILKNTDMQRMTGSLSLDPTFLDGSLKVNVKLKGMSTNNNFGDAGAIGSAVNMDPTQPVFDGNPSSDGYFQWNNYGANLGTPNPLEQALAIDNRSTVNRVMGNLIMNYRIPMIPELLANLNVATDYSHGEGYNNRPVTSPSVLTSPLWGRLSDYSATNRNSLLDFYLNYTRELAEIESNVDLTGGYSWQHFQREGENYTRGVVDDEHPYQMTDSTQYITENYLVSFFGRANYSYKSRYLLTATVRFDGSSRFAKGNQWGIFPSAAFAWRIDQEEFLRDVSIINDLKLRLGWGITGQQDIGNDYPAQATYIISSPGSYYPIGGEFIPTLRPNAYDPDIKWEETTTLNAGLDFGLLNNRIAGSVDVYHRVTNDLLNTVVIPSGSNFSNQLLTNVGSLENKGLEISLNAVPVSKKDLSLNIGFNFTYNVNKITKLLISEDPDYIGILYGDAFTGQKQVTRVGYPAYSFFLNKQIYDADGNPIEGLYEDLSGEGGLVSGDNNDKYIYHNPVPDYLMGLSFRFNYKNFDAMASSRVSIGNYVYNQVAAGASYDQMYQIGYWKNFPTFLSGTNFVKRQFTSDYFVENASYFKLDNVSVGYTREQLFDLLDARISITAQNLVTISKYGGLDPEVPGGIDNNFYPRPRIIMFGISLTY